MLNAQLAGAGAFGPAQIDVDQSGTIAAWTRRNGTVAILAGTPEEGLRDDADRGRSPELALAARWARRDWRQSWPGAAIAAAGRRLTVTLTPQGSSRLSCRPTTDR